MTKNERTALQGFMNKLADINREMDERFEELKELNRTFGTHTAWCNAQSNYKDIMENADPMIQRKAQSVYDRYMKLSGEHDLLNEYGEMLAGISFWK